MAQLHLFFPTLLRFEGGFVDDPADPGGATNMGITFTTFRRYAKPLLGVPPELEHLRKLDARQAGRIYKVEYWDRIHGDDIPFQPLADILFDFYVNAGSHAVVCLYKALNATGANHAVHPLLSAEVIQSLGAHDLPEVYMHFKQARRAYYLQLAHDHPALRRFLKGWLARVDAFPDIKTGVAAGANACRPP
jgi:type VI secretion system secreted protein VgrG